MLVIDSNHYEPVSYNCDEQMWTFDRITTPEFPSYREKLVVSDVKFVDKSDNLCYRYYANGSRVVTSKLSKQ